MDLSLSSVAPPRVSRSTGSRREKPPAPAGSRLGSASSQNSHFPLAEGLVGGSKCGGRAADAGAERRARRARGPATRPRGTAAERCRPASSPARPAAALRRHPSKPNADCWNKKGRPGKMRLPKKKKKKRLLFAKLRSEWCAAKQ